MITRYMIGYILVFLLSLFIIVMPLLSTSGNSNLILLMEAYKSSTY